MNVELLKKFNKADIEAGATLVRYSSENQYLGEFKYVAGPDKAGEVAILDESGFLWVDDGDNLLIKPVFELDGKPVYPGNTFWLSWDSVIYQVRIESFRNTSISIDTPIAFSIRQRISKVPDAELLKACSWKRPKQKKEAWINIYGWESGSIGGPYASKEIADQKASLDCRVDCVKITWEE